MNNKSKKFPESLNFRSPLTIEAAGEKQPPRFSMIAYTGGEMRVDGFPHPVVVDLEGVDITRQEIPVRMDHNPRQGVGHTSRVEIRDGKILAEGLVSRDTSWARDVTKSGTNGFPWQASIGAAVVDAELIPHGQKVIVNSREFVGPIHVVRKSVLKEISFVDSGADSNTAAKVAAKKTEDKEQNDMADNETKPKTPSDQAAKTNPPAKVADTVNAAAIAKESVLEYRQKIAAETLRIENIRKLCGDENADIQAKAIEEGWDLAKTELHILRASRPNVPSVITRQAIATPEVFEAVALMGSGMGNTQLEANYTGQILEAADKLRGIGIQEFCELASGQRLPRFRRDSAGWLEAAFSTTSLPGILSNIANKMLLEGYSYIEDTWRKICKIASVNDFKEHTRYRMTGSFTFEQVGPGGELKHGKLGEQSFGQKAETHGIMFALTRQMIINDDMGAFTDIPRQIGMGAAEAIADAVWTRWLANPQQKDGKEFFHADHKNLLAGAESALSIAGLTNAEVAFSSQVKPNGRPLGVPASIMLVPIALKVVAQQLMTALTVNENTTKAKPANNPHVGKFEVVSSSYLSNASFADNSSKAWCLMADPNRILSIEVAFLNGIDRPTVEKTDADFNTLGIQFRGFIDFGVREQDHRGALKLAGE